MLPSHINGTRQRGAALLIMVAVLGIGVSAALIGIFSNNHIESLRRQRTDAMLAQAREALIGYTLVYGRLPRPAISATDGRENTAPCTTPASCTGFLPWVTLGVDGADSWGKLLRYSVTPGYTRAPVVTYQVIADKTVVSRYGPDSVVYRVGQPVCERAAPCAPAVIFSSGKNNLGTSVTGIALANGAKDNIDEQNNNVSADSFISRPQENNPAVAGGEFDDLVTWIPLPVLLKALKTASTNKP